MIVVHVIEPFATGINTFLQELVFGIPDYEHIIIHGERKDHREIEQIKSEYKGKVRFIKWNNAQREIKLIPDIKAFFELRRILKSIPFDVLHLHSSKAGVLGQLLLSKQFKKMVYTPNAASFLRTDISPKKIKLYTWIEKITNKISKAQIVSSSQSERDEYSKIGINTTLILNGASVPSEAIARNSQDSVFRVVFCGKITIQKNPALFNQIALHYHSNPHISFTWIGDGELRETLSQEAIHITGWQSKKEIYRRLNTADCYLSASSWEGLSLATIEASAFGIPLLLKDCVGNRDMIEKDINGFLFDTKEQAIEKIDLLMNNKDKKEEISRNSRENYQQQYGNFRCGMEYKKLYDEIAKTNNFES